MPLIISTNITRYTPFHTAKQYPKPDQLWDRILVNSVLYKYISKHAYVLY